MFFDNLDDLWNECDYELLQRTLESMSDPEYSSRIDAERVTLEFRCKSRRPLDSGRQPITEGPLFGGPAQGELF